MKQLTFLFYAMIISCVCHAQPFINNSGFETGSPLPSAPAQMDNADYWQTSQFFNAGFYYHSPDWYVVDSFHLEEPLGTDGDYETIFGNNLSNGYAGMRSCEMIRQELQQSLSKDDYYVICYFMRVPEQGTRASQDHSFQVNSGNPVKIEFVFTKVPVNYTSLARHCDEERCYYYDFPAFTSRQYIDTEIDPSSFPNKKWIKLLAPPFKAKKDWEWMHMQMRSLQQIEECNEYLLFDDIQIFGGGCNANCNSCVYPTDGFSNVGCNQLNTGSVPLSLFNLENVDALSYTITDFSGQVVFTGAASCPNGWEQDSVHRIDVPNSLAVGYYNITVALSNQCGNCIKTYSWYYEDIYTGSLLGTCNCRNEGIIRPCCENQFEADQYSISCDEDYVLYSAIDDLEVGTSQNFEVLNGTMATFEAGNSIVFGPNFETQTGSEMTAEVAACTQNKKGETRNRLVENASSLFDDAEEVRCFPNPSNGTINLLSQWPEKTEVEVYNLLGQMVQSLQIDENEMSSIKLSNSGMFSVVFLNGGHRVVKKVIIN